MLNEWEMGLHHFGDPVAVCLPIEEYERLVGLATMQAVR